MQILQKNNAFIKTNSDNLEEKLNKIVKNLLKIKEINYNYYEEEVDEALWKQRNKLVDIEMELRKKGAIPNF